MSTTDANTYFSLIAMKLDSLRSNDFQAAAGIILNFYYKKINKKFDMPSSSFGGDYKNDGWVKDDLIYYQIHSPIVDHGKSLKSVIVNKFSDDFKGLLKNVYDLNKWKKPIKKFIFICNNGKEELPAMTEEECIKIGQDECESRNIDTPNIQVVSSRYLKDMVADLLLMPDGLENGKALSIRLEVPNINDILNTNQREIYNFLSLMNDKYIECDLSGEGSDYIRKSSEKKIEINNLKEAGERIKKYVSHLNIFDDYVNGTTIGSNEYTLFDNARKFVIGLYEKWSAYSLSGDDIYFKILEDIGDYLKDESKIKNITELFVIYIFDKCDIFKKE